jgi:hypothetical protein
MKRCRIDREELAIHEAGHLVAIALLPDFEPGDLVWCRFPRYEIAHVEPIPSTRFDWETPSDRNTLIVRRAVAALAGGAAVEVCGRLQRHSTPDLSTIHDVAGKVDFELAHEWLTLQRHDPDQRLLETEISRLFLEIVDVLRASIYRAAIETVSRRILDRLQAADAARFDRLAVPAAELLEDLLLPLRHGFRLEETVANLHRDA